MKYVIFAYNFLTLSKTLRYVDSIWTREKSLILYTNTASSLPITIAEKYNCVLYDYNDFSVQHYPPLKKISCAVRFFWKALCEFVPEGENVTLVVYRDNQYIECSMIDQFHKKYHSSQIMLMEEGAGLYLGHHTDRDNYFRRILRKAKYKLLYGLSSSNSPGKPFGYNPYINKVVGSKVDGLRERYKGTEVLVEQQIDVFTPEFVRTFVENIIDHEIEPVEYDYVFLTQPVKEFVGGSEKEVVGIYETFLLWFFSRIGKEKKLIIKPHPRDDFDYSKFVNERIALCDKEMNKLPYECLSVFWKFPREFTFYSSACINSKCNRTGVYMYKLLKNNLVGDIVDMQYVKDNGIFICESENQLERILNEA